jgi:predicted lysophospholipase L1 biosynthesis ABC-type transport system permease subunit
MSYVVSQRTGEIGVRLALGAEPSSVARMIVRQGGVVALAGIAVGLAVAVAGSRLIESLLYGVGPRDPGVFAGTTLVLLAVALLACWLPARRAARLSPLEALKAEEGRKRRRALPEAGHAQSPSGEPGAYFRHFPARLGGYCGPVRFGPA